MKSRTYQLITILIKIVWWYWILHQPLPVGAFSSYKAKNFSFHPWNQDISETLQGLISVPTNESSDTPINFGEICKSQLHKLYINCPRLGSYPFPVTVQK